MSTELTRDAACPNMFYGTGAAAIDHIVTLNGNKVLKQVRLHLSTGSAAENFVVSLDSARGSAYDVVLKTVAMNALTDYYWEIYTPFFLKAGDVIKFTKTNGATLTWGLEVELQTAYTSEMYRG